jgi:hypothetical protein
MAAFSNRQVRQVKTIGVASNHSSMTPPLNDMATWICLRHHTVPLNRLDARYRSFQNEMILMARDRGLAVFGMKSMGGSGEIISSSVRCTPGLEGLVFKT